MWIAIILIVVVYILYRFFSDREKMIKSVEAKGGIQEKYKILLSYILNEPDSKIVHLTRDNIEISWTGECTFAQFSITQNFGTVDINWVSNNGPAGTVKEKWQFRENLDQHAIAKKMMQDIEFKLQHGLHWGTQNKIALNKDYLESKNEKQSKLIIPGVGVDGIILNKTTFKEVERKYGEAYNLINHNNFSFEMRYDQIGLSCYYKKSDLTNTIFFIQMRKEFGAYTDNNISLIPAVSVADIAKIYRRKQNYGTSDSADYAYIDYGAIKFYVNKTDAYSKPAEDTYINSIGIGQ